MKKLIIIISLLFSTQCYAGDYKFYFFGVDMDWLQEAKNEDIGKLFLGMVSSIAIHEAGHYLYLKHKGYDTSYSLTISDNESNLDEMSNSDIRNWSRAGFFAQTLVATCLTSFEKTRYSYFTRGLVMTNDVQIWTYKMRRKGRGDVYHLDYGGGDGSQEWAIYSAIGLHNTLRLNW